MGKNVAVFVDVANIFYAAKAAGVDIDYVTLLKSATAGRDFVRAYAYTGLDPENENQRNFHQFLARHSYKVVSKDIRKYGDGKVKANLDIELVVDLMKTARNLDIAVVVSGDGDFASAIRAVQEMGVRVEVISFRGNTSSDLMDVADLFTDITQIAKVDKGSTRSGRRVAGDEEDLSMTEVPEKQSEGTGRGRGRGRGRSRSDRDDGTAATTSRAKETAAPSGAAPSGAALVAMPGEKLSRAAKKAQEAPEAVTEAEEAEAVDAVAVAEGSQEEQAETESGEGEGRRRRRRRGGRGRGRGRRDEGASDDAEATGEPATGSASDAPRETGRRERSGELPTPFDDFGSDTGPRAPRSTPFGSVWDRQLGTSTTRPSTSGVQPLSEDEEDLEEPEIPEYLITEQRRGRRRGGRGGRGTRGAYSAAVERERYGGGRGGSGRYAEPSRSGSGAGSRSARQDRTDRAPRSQGGEPWSEVPPELEEALRAQMAQSQGGADAAPAEDTPEATAAKDGAAAESDADAKPKRRTTRRSSSRTKATEDTPEG